MNKVTILQKIADAKRKEVAKRRELFPEKLLEQSVYFGAEPVSLARYLRREDRVGVIAEFKRRSPSEGDINPTASVEEISIGYMQAGASALSVLTDFEFFGGSVDDLRNARRFNYCPILRKDFTLDRYQIVEAKSIGADAILLIARLLDAKTMKDLADYAHGLGLEVLAEVHDASELERACIDSVDLVGVNNRNLDDFTVSLDRSLELVDQIPKSFVSVSESGISTPEAIVKLKSAGYQGFLVGTAFMRTARPADSCRALVESVRKMQVAAEGA